MESEAEAGDVGRAGKAQREARVAAGDLASVIARTARLLEQSANLAEQHAQRRAEQGQEHAAEEERRTALRAHEASRQAWARVQRIRELGGETEPEA